MRWPVGNDATHMIALRQSLTDEEWEDYRRRGLAGELRRPLFEAPAGGHGPADGSVVLITGASRGFGAAAARACARRGDTVIATMRNPERDAAAVQEGLAERIHPMRLDVTSGEQVEETVRQALDHFGRVDVLVNNAGYGLYGPAEDLTEDEVRRQFDTNLLGQFRMIRAVLPAMRARGSGKIVNVSSLSGQVSGPLTSMYAASKHAVEAMSEALADEVAGAGIQVTILEPGMYSSDWQTNNLDVCAAIRDGRSVHQSKVEQMLISFRKLAATRPGSDAVAEAIADIVQLQQPLPLRWPVGEDCVRMIRARRSASDDEWEERMASLGWGFEPGNARGPK
jgi:NAD(P)-dependent dehydrogenase (short-subunit alcohol dehydrogenase family)